MSLDGQTILDLLAENKSLLKLISLMYTSFYDNIPFPKEKLIGDWDQARPGMRVKITYTDPNYYVDEGFLMVLPGMNSSDMLQGGIVYVHESEQTEQKIWYNLKYLAIFCDTIELETLW
jgi:hypothetical protein